MFINRLNSFIISFKMMKYLDQERNLLIFSTKNLTPIYRRIEVNVLCLTFHRTFLFSIYKLSLLFINCMRVGAGDLGYIELCCTGNGACLILYSPVLARLSINNFRKFKSSDGIPNIYPPLLFFYAFYNIYRYFAASILKKVRMSRLTRHS